MPSTSATPVEGLIDKLRRISHPPRTPPMAVAALPVMIPLGLASLALKRECLEVLRRVLITLARNPDVFRHHGISLLLNCLTMAASSGSDSMPSICSVAPSAAVLAASLLGPQICFIGIGQSALRAADPGLTFSLSYTTRDPSPIRRRCRSIESWFSGMSTSSLSPMLRTGPSLARIVRKVWPPRNDR